MAAPLPLGKKTLFLGTFVHCKTLDELEFRHGSAVFVDGGGVMVAVEEGCDLERAEKTVYPKLGWEVEDVVACRAREGEFFFPGFIDTHIHASQHANMGLFGNTTLLDWLTTYTFPMENSLASASKARMVYQRCIKRTLSHGTTTACYFATTSVSSTNLLADLCLSHGQRAFVGRVCMDTLSPDWYRDESPASAIEDTRACIQHMEMIDPSRALVTPIITPRFAPSCSPELLHGLGKLKDETGLPVQTHVSENKNEVALVASLFPESKSYTHVYAEHGLLGPSTILAHGVHLALDEARMIAETKSKISHCPVSNTAITSGLARIRWMLDLGIDVGLGTDVSGGYSSSMLEAVRHAVLVSRLVALDGEERDKLSVEEALFLATKGGAKVTGLEEKVGAFEKGKLWDAQLIGLGSVSLEDGEDEGVEKRPVDIFGWETWDERVAKWVFGGDDRNTLAVWVAGRLVHRRNDGHERRQ